MDSVTIRRATPADAEAISELNADVQRLHADALPWLFKPATADTFPSAAAAALIAKPTTILLLALADGTPVGYAYAEIRQRGETGFARSNSSVYLHHISVRPAMQRKGVGSALLAALRTAAAGEGITRLEVDVWRFNESARQFFAHHGFVVYNERMWTI